MLFFFFVCKEFLAKLLAFPLLLQGFLGVHLGRKILVFSVVFLPFSEKKEKKIRGVPVTVLIVGICADL